MKGVRFTAQFTGNLILSDDDLFEIQQKAQLGNAASEHAALTEFIVEQYAGLNIHDIKSVITYDGLDY